MWASGCRSALPGLSASPQVSGRVRPCEGVRHVPWRGAGASPSAPAPHRPERIERGGHVSGRHDALPRGGDGVWMTSTTPRSHCRTPWAQTQLVAASVPERSLGGIDRPSPERGEKHVVTSFPREIGDFTEPFRRRDLPPRSVSAQLRPGKHHGETVGENSPPPRRDPRDPR
jgi:hypothetical protein